MAIERRATTALLFACGLLAACSTVPRIDGRRASEFTPEQVLVVAGERFAAKDWPAAADLSEYLIKNHFKFERLEEARWIAAESRFEAGDYPDAFTHYQRLLTEDQLHRRSPAIAKRVWVIGKTLSREQSALFTDFSARHDVGLEALTFLVTQFPRCDDADDAWKELAECFAADQRWQEAADSYERLARDYPDSEWVDLALYRVADVYRRLSRGGSYDVDPLLRAHAALERYLARFAEGNFIAAAGQEKLELEREIGRREIQIAEFYALRGNTDGRLRHLANAATRFPATPEATEALALLAAAGAGTELNTADLLRPREDRPPWRRAPASTIDPKTTPGASDREGK